MAFGKVGFNATGINNISAPELNIPETGGEFLDSLPSIANTNALGFFAYVALGFTFLICYWILSDNSPFGEFKYSEVRAFNLASGITALIGWTMLEIGYLVSLRAVAIPTIVFLISHIYMIMANNKQ